MANLGVNKSKKAILSIAFNAIFLSSTLFIQTAFLCAMEVPKKSSLSLSCSACNKSFSSPDASKNHALNQHLLNGYSHKCFHDGCNFVTARWPIGLMDHHAKEHENKLSSCTICKQTYKEKKEHINKIINTHAIEGLDEREKSDLINNDIKTLKYIQLGQTERKQILQKSKLTNQLDCSFCEKKFANRSSLKAHEQKHGDKLSAVNYQPTQAVNSLECNICKKIFANTSNLEEHQQKHREKTVGIKFSCAHTIECIAKSNKYYSTYYAYLEHHKDIHNRSAAECDALSCKAQHNVNSKLHCAIKAGYRLNELKKISDTKNTSEDATAFDETIFELPMELIQSNLSSEITDECQHDNLSSPDYNEFPTNSWDDSDITQIAKYPRLEE